MNRHLRDQQAPCLFIPNFDGSCLATQALHVFLHAACPHQPVLFFSFQAIQLSISLPEALVVSCSLLVECKSRSCDRRHNASPSVLHWLCTPTLIQGTIAKTGATDRVYSGCKPIAPDAAVRNIPPGKESRDAPAPGAEGASHRVQLLHAEVQRVHERVQMHPLFSFILGFYDRLSGIRFRLCGIPNECISGVLSGNHLLGRRPRHSYPPSIIELPVIPADGHGMTQEQLQIGVHTIVHPMHH